jgi:hypothetical protein
MMIVNNDELRRQMVRFEINVKYYLTSSGIQFIPYLLKICKLFETLKGGGGTEYGTFVSLLFLKKKNKVGQTEGSVQGRHVWGIQ